MPSQAGEAGPDDFAVGNGAAGDLLDGAEVEMAGAVVGGVDGGLLRANVVRPDGGQACLAPWVTRPLPAKKSTKVGREVFRSSFEQFLGRVATCECSQ
jgi:hypothetical protein